MTNSFNAECYLALLMTDKLLVEPLSHCSRKIKNYFEALVV